MVAALAAITGCGGGAEPIERFDIRLALDNASADGSCGEATTCDDFPMLCAATVGIWIRELPSASAGADAGLAKLIAEDCVQLAGGGSQTLCALSTIDVTFEDIPRRRGTIEVAVWPTGDGAGAMTECPEVEFNSVGRVKDPLSEPALAFARRIFFDFAGTEPIATVPLACEDPNSVQAPSCRAKETEVRAVIADFALLFSLDLEQARNLNVSVGQVTPAGSPDTYEILQAETTRLLLASSPIVTAPEFAATVEDVFDPANDVCVILLDQVNPTPRSTVTCERIPDPPPTELDLLSYMLVNDDLQSILNAAGIDNVPNEGIVVGRVVSGFAGLDGAVVAPSLPAASILYLSDDLSSTDGLAATSGSGYFVATGVPYPAEWTASRAGFASPVPAPRGGVINQRITVLLLRMTPL